MRLFWSEQVLRKAASRSSTRVGDLTEGTVVIVLERASEGAALGGQPQHRVRVRAEREDGPTPRGHPSMQAGWCSVRSAKDGSR